jgi:hypothetical protein
MERGAGSKREISRKAAKGAKFGKEEVFFAPLRLGAVNFVEIRALNI